MIARYLASQIQKDLTRRMVFVAGPRQVGKTTLARAILESPEGYLNWDVPEHKEAILRGRFPKSKLLVLDEIHKYRNWRNLLKGLWDGRDLRPPDTLARILVTGSARLDLYRHGGDSLQGRYHMLRLYPLSAAEIGASSRDDLEALRRLGGFPEPFLSGSETEARRWSREYRTRLVREDIASLENLQDLDRIELLALRLPELVGSPLSINSLREDLNVSHKAAATWCEILERTYSIFRLRPFGAPRLRAVKKERKHYHFDWTLVRDPAARFENLVAFHLLKWAHWRQDAFGEEIELCFFRDIDKREVDFVLTLDGRPTHFIEAKTADSDPVPGLRYLKIRFPDAQAWQLSLAGAKDYVTSDGIRVAPALEFLRGLV